MWCTNIGKNLAWPGQWPEHEREEKEVPHEITTVHEIGERLGSETADLVSSDDESEGGLESAEDEGELDDLLENLAESARFHEDWDQGTISGHDSQINLQPPLLAGASYDHHYISCVRQ
jgi:hypothetical protein